MAVANGEGGGSPDLRHQYFLRHQVQADSLNDQRNPFIFTKIGRVLKLTTDLNVKPRLQMRGALLLQYAFVA